MEAGIQRAILTLLQYLENEGKVYFVRNNSFGGRVQRYDGSFGHIKNAKRGSPDILVCVNTPGGGIFVGIEVKSPSGRQSSEQKEAQTAIEKAGGKYYLARSVDDVEQELRALGVVF